MDRLRLRLRPSAPQHREQHSNGSSWSQGSYGDRQVQDDAAWGQESRPGEGVGTWGHLARPRWCVSQPLDLRCQSSDKGPRDATRVGESGQRLCVGLSAGQPTPLAARAQVKPRLCCSPVASSRAPHITPLAFESFNYKTRRSHWACAEVHPGAGFP